MTPRAIASSAREYAELYLGFGWSVVPLLPGKKECRDANWTKTVYAPEQFEPHDNIGLRSVNGLVVVDVDSPEAVACAARFLPPSGAIWGRKSKPASKHLYRSSFEKTIALKDSDAGDTLIEIRSQHQDMAPPSVHPSSEVLEWVTKEFDAPTVESDALLRAVRLIATCALVSRNYQAPGARHEWVLALAGVLRSVNVTEPEGVNILKGAASWANDPKIDDRLTELHSTYTRGDDEPTAGAGKLVELMDRGKVFVRSLYKIWGSAGGFVTDDKGKIVKSQENILRALAKLDVTLRFDLFAHKPLIKWGKRPETPLEDDDAIDLRLLCDKQFKFLPAKDLFVDVLMSEARANAFHPVREYLASRTWDKVPRLETWLIDSAKAGDSPYTKAVSRIVLCAAVRRVVEPGCKFDEMVVLESGTQGLLKSSALRALVPNEAWFTDSLPLNADTAEVIECTAGKWIVEVSDLDGISAAQVDRLKATLSRQVDGPVRLAYGRISTERKRAFIVIGTTNSYSYLQDSTGNRRFWPVRVGKFDLKWIVQHRDQLWAEAYHYIVNKDVSIRLDPALYEQAAIQQERRRNADPWEPLLQQAFPPGLEKHERVTPDQVFGALCLLPAQRDMHKMKRINEIMQTLGFRRQTVVDRGPDGDGSPVRVKGWARDATDQQPLPEMTHQRDGDDE